MTASKRGMLPLATELAFQAHDMFILYIMDYVLFKLISCAPSGEHSEYLQHKKVKPIGKTFSE